MSKHGSEEGQQGRKEVPATGQSPLPAYGSHAIQKILERVSPSNVLEYRAMLDEAGFDTLESLALPVAEFREEVAGMKAGLSNSDQTRPKHMVYRCIARGQRASYVPNIELCYS